MNDIVRAGALRRYELLKAAAASPGRASAALIAACASQNALAQLRLIAQGVEPMALNSLKRAANVAIEQGGWQALDKLRREVARLSRTSRRPNGPAAQNKANLKAALQEMKSTVDQLHRARLRVEHAYTDLLRLARSAAAGNEKLRNQLDRHLAMFAERVGISMIKGGNPDAQ